MANNKNQHWVPQFYLKEFATPDSISSANPQIWAFPKDEGEIFKTSIRNVSAKNYLYSPIDEDGKRDNIVDDRLREVENLLARLWPTVTTRHYPLDDGFRKGVALFLATLYLRHPNKLAAQKSWHEALVSVLDSAPKQEDGTPDIRSIEIAGRNMEVDLGNWPDFKNATANDVKRMWGEQILKDSGFFAKHLLTQS